MLRLAGFEETAGTAWGGATTGLDQALEPDIDLVVTQLPQSVEELGLRRVQEVPSPKQHVLAGVVLAPQLRLPGQRPQRDQDDVAGELVDPGVVILSRS